jgi:hypothetical protein
MRTIIIIILVSTCILSCKQSEGGLAGVYVKEPAINTKDTLFLYENKQYKQVLYNSSGLHLLTNNAQWYVGKNGRVELLDFFLNYDFDTKDYSYSEEAIKTAVISSSLPVKGNRIIIDEDRKVFYEKIK